jgi:hypothetical protein
LKFRSLNKTAINFSTSSLDLNTFVFQSIFAKAALNLNFPLVNSTDIFQDSVALKFCISLSFSTISFTATD